MDNEILNRITRLYSELGLNMQSGSDDKGEAAAMACGLKLITQQLDRMMKNVFIQTADKEGIGMFLSLINKSRTDNQEADRESVLNSMACGGYLQKSDFENNAALISSRFEYNASDLLVQLKGLIAEKNYKSLKAASEFVKNYVPVCCNVDFAGSGMDFDAFDALGIYWFQLDDIDMPFYMIETIN